MIKERLGRCCQPELASHHTRLSSLCHLLLRGHLKVLSCCNRNLCFCDSLHGSLIKSPSPQSRPVLGGAPPGWHQGRVHSPSVLGHLCTIAKHSYALRLMRDVVVVCRKKGTVSGTVRETEKPQPWKRTQALVGLSAGLKREEVQWPAGEKAGGELGPGELASLCGWPCSLHTAGPEPPTSASKLHSNLAGRPAPRAGVGRSGVVVNDDKPECVVYARNSLRLGVGEWGGEIAVPAFNWLI